MAKPTKWENATYYSPNGTPTSSEHDLNKLGQAGWEPYAVISNGTGVTYYLKRSK